MINFLHESRQDKSPRAIILDAGVDQVSMASPRGVDFVASRRASNGDADHRGQDRLAESE